MTKLTQVEVQHVPTLVAHELIIAPIIPANLRPPFAVLQSRQPRPWSRPTVQPRIAPGIPLLPVQTEVHDRQRVTLLVQRQLGCGARIDGNGYSALFEDPLRRVILRRVGELEGIDGSDADGEGVNLIAETVLAGAGV